MKTIKLKVYQYYNFYPVIILLYYIGIIIESKADNSENTIKILANK